MLKKCRLPSRHNGPTRAASAIVLGGIAVAGMLVTTAIASTPGSPQGDPVSLLAPTAPAPAAVASAPIPAPVDTPIHNRIESADLRIDGQKLHAALLRQFYAAHDFQPVWESRKAQAEALLRAVARAGEHGLDVELFHAALLRKLASLSPIDRDLVLSDAFLAYADALARGAVPIENRYDDEDLTPDPIDVAAVLTQAIDSPDPASVIEGLAPRSPAYLALQRALQSYRSDDFSAARAGGASRSSEAQRRALIVNLERLRWLPRQLPADRIWVNIPTARLELYRDNRPVFVTRVVVGEIDKQTPELKTAITSLLFNPPWYVPPSIIRSEIMPKLARDPNYLARHHMVWRSNGGIQQLPGPGGTALGRLKFEATNRFDVYLHDTPLKSLFSRSNRFDSHGCVRVENPRQLGALLLGEPVEAIDRAIARSVTARRMLPKAIPTFLVYQTAYLDSSGAIAFAPDIYDRDETIWNRLQRATQVPVAQHDRPAERKG